jgi:hypothetical protein
MTRQREFSPADRYLYDFRVCTVAKGWAQIDTRQDASYFGQWINPAKRLLFSYCEGDTCLTTCDDDTELLAEMEHIRTFHNESGYAFLGIDPGFSEGLKAALIAAGLGGFFHASEAISA